jgi:hypothetical protein
MAKPYYLLIFVLAIAIAYSQSQTSGSGSAAGQATPANNAGSVYGNSTSGNQQAPGQSNMPSSQPLPGTTQSTPAATGTQPANKPGSATDASGGGVAGAAGSGTGQAQVAETPNPSANPPVSDTELQSQIQNALSKEPTLSGDSVRVSVAEDSIEMSGNVATPREKLTASRIVQSYAGNKKVVSHVTIGAHSGGNPSTPAATRENANPSANPEPNKGTPPAATQPPQH